MKEVFIYEIEQGCATLIPQEISQYNWPMSFRYYDSMLPLIQENISNHKRENLMLKQKLAFQLHS